MNLFKYSMKKPQGQARLTDFQERIVIDNYNVNTRSQGNWSERSSTKSSKDHSTFGASGTGLNTNDSLSIVLLYLAVLTYLIFT